MTRTGVALVRRRVASVAGMAAAAVGAVFALGGCAIAALLGNGPGFLGLIAIVIAAALVFGLVARAIVSRIDVAVAAAFIARRLAGRRRR
jgi:hypothetical protein